MGSVSVNATIRVGLDIMAADQVADSIERFGNRYLERVYTEHEIASCTGVTSLAVEGLAARFAAKEATIKILRSGDYQPDWRSIEVHRSPEGWCDLSLSGHAASLAHRAGIAELALSLTHEGGVAAAVVIAWCREPMTPSEGNETSGQDEFAVPGIP
jgi:holo-[acyl-carrier protein] synthase